MSLVAPKPPLTEWSNPTSYKQELTQLKCTHAMDGEAKRAANMAARRASFQTVGEKAMALMNAAPEPDDVNPRNARAKQQGKESKQVHIPVALTQDPGHAHFRLPTKHAHQRQKEHEVRHESRHPTKGSMCGSSQSGMRPATADLSTNMMVLDSIAPALKALAVGTDGTLSLADIGSMSLPSMSMRMSLPSALNAHFSQETIQKHQEPGPQVNNHELALHGTLAAIDSPRSFESEMEREAEDHDLHHLDPGLDDTGTCRIGKEVRHCAPTGFMKPTNTLSRYGVCT